MVERYEHTVDDLYLALASGAIILQTDGVTGAVLSTLRSEGGLFIIDQWHWEGGIIDSVASASRSALAKAFAEEAVSDETLMTAQGMAFLVEEGFMPLHEALRLQRMVMMNVFPSAGDEEEVIFLLRPRERVLLERVLQYGSANLDELNECFDDSYSEEEVQSLLAQVES
jgi:hypothetical protein